MASAVRTPGLINSTVRNYAALAKAAQSPSASTDQQVLSNKVKVAAVDNNNALAQVSIIFKAGSRNETYETQGLSHILRCAAGLTTSRSSTFGITRNIQQLGANLMAVCDRESTAYTLQVTHNNLEKALMFLEDMATRQVFKPWELSDMMPRVRYELSTLPENVKIIELLHKAAYRTGLGFSLYSPKRQLGNISSETLQHFVNNWFTGSNCAVVGTGVSMSLLSDFAKTLNMGTGSSTSSASKYRGGEVRKDRNSPIANVAIAVESSGLNNEKDALAFAVLQQAAGIGPHVKWGNSPAPLQRAAGSAAGSEPFAVTAFNATYTDSGLFGAVIQSPPSVAGPIVKAVNKWMKSPNVTDTDIARGKTELKAIVLDSADTYSGQLEHLSHTVLYKGAPMSANQLVAEIDKVSAADVKKVAGKLSGKLSMAAIGNLSTVPYVDEL